MPPHTHYVVHNVKKGDSLDRIAHHFRTTVNKLRKWNDIEKNHYIHPGQEIYIYYTDKGVSL